MPDELTNLLPADRRDTIRRDYFIRLSTVVLVLASALFLASAALLAPSYVFLAKRTAAEKTFLANLDAAASSAEERALSARLSALSDDATRLSALASTRSSSSVIRAFLAVPHQGIAILGVGYTPAAGTGSGILSVSGSAKTRDALRNYQLALQNAPFSRSVDLPVSAYAKEADIPFSMTVTLASP